MIEKNSMGANGRMRDEWVLSNGLRVVGERLPFLRSVSIGAWMHVGSMMEEPQENGLSHFLEHMVFKGTQKRTARQIAEEQGFINARKKDSQDICFVPDGDYVAFMERYTGKKYQPGDYLDLNGNVVGRHRGAVCYTLGQRKGLNLAMGAPVYVVAKDMEKNTVTVGPNEALFSSTLVADNWNWFPFETLTAPIEVTAKARYNQQPQPATVYPEADGKARVVFHQPQRALTPGQAVVLYDGDMVVGGGTIIEVVK